ncbi:MAG: helix-turn-helix transcriptional regulator [Planctomycetales bacterium]|nr:helix-turn-helix transcriptional regulator [Planctomycetales bacterium]
MSKKKEQENRKEIGRRIRSTRRSKEMTAQHLAKKAKVSTGYLSEVERGLSPVSVDKLRSIASVLGVDLNFVLEGSAVTNADTSAEVRIPTALAAAAEQLDLSYVVTASLLNGRRSLVAKRSSGPDDEWTAEQWIEFYEKVKEFV